MPSKRPSEADMLPSAKRTAILNHRAEAAYLRGQQQLDEAKAFAAIARGEAAAAKAEAAAALALGKAEAAIHRGLARVHAAAFQTAQFLTMAMKCLGRKFGVIGGRCNQSTHHARRRGSDARRRCLASRQADHTSFTASRSDKSGGLRCYCEIQEKMRSIRPFAKSSGDGRCIMRQNRNRLSKL